MSNGTGFTSTRVFRALLLSALFATAACDNPSRQPLPRHAPGTSLLDPSDGGRERSDPARNRVWILNAQGVFLYHVSTGKLVEITLGQRRYPVHHQGDRSSSAQPGPPMRHGQVERNVP